MTTADTPLSELRHDHAFLARHIGPTAGEQTEMLATLGYDSLDALTKAAVPATIRSSAGLALGAPTGEENALADLRRIAEQNKVMRNLIGRGYHDCHVPAVIQRNVLENPGWYTSYTPYQPEISQGRLEALLNFQTMVSDLTAMDIANASLLDEATAAAEAMTFCWRLSKNKSDVFFVSDACHEQTIDVLRTRAGPIGIEIVIGDERQGVPADAFAILLQYPESTGELRDPTAVIAAAHAQNTMAIVAADLLALTIMKPPGEMGADVVVGSAQRFGVPLGFGGPHAAFFATREAHKRAMPGRLVGVSVDSHGAPALRLALQTREQHIRREKATSNICTAQALLAIMASMYGVYHGPDGLRRIAWRVHRLTAVLVEGLRRLNYRIEHDTFFGTVMVKTADWSASVWEAARIEGINLRWQDGTIGISLDETCDRELVETLWRIMAFDSFVDFDFETIEAHIGPAIPPALLRNSDFMTHPVFNSHHSETEMMRYIRALMDKDIALDRAMIPLGSCTMKLNAASEMAPVSWPEFNRIHPFAPVDQSQGYRQMIAELEDMLCAATGYAAVSLQPNAGSQGEFAGLMVIRAYHESRGEGHRNICLIPGSAHGTNPASAAMAGMTVVVVECDNAGNVDLADLTAKAEAHSANLAALMVTYPSTHGVFEASITEVCAIIHAHGGQVYIDGANLNAMVGLCQPGRFGGDVSHLNLHKTFCIPHGGGGPGVGPIGVAAHLAPFLPGHSRLGDAPDTAIGAIAAAPYGSASILPISWMYMKMMGGEGLCLATQVAILNANYIARRLADHYPILYTGPDGLIAHECIIDLRPLKETSGVSVEDVAKRLIDFGFHAPTMSFPVAGTLMIEPTESESKTEIDRFCEAMITIRGEIAAIEKGTVALADSPVAHAPHTAGDLMAENWTRAYARTTGAFPDADPRRQKYWPPVGRIDNVYGDRNLVCACPPMDVWRDAAD